MPRPPQAYTTLLPRCSRPEQEQRSGTLPLFPPHLFVTLVRGHVLRKRYKFWRPVEINQSHVVPIRAAADFTYENQAAGITWRASGNKPNPTGHKKTPLPSMNEVTTKSKKLKSLRSAAVVDKDKVHFSDNGRNPRADDRRWAPP